NLAIAHGKQRFYHQAEELLARALSFAPRKASIYRRVGQAYAKIDRPERAIECLRRSLELNRDAETAVQTLLELSQLHERAHKVDDERAVFQHSVIRDH